MALEKNVIRGVVSTADRVSNIHPEDWRQKIYQEAPVGRAPMTAHMMAMSSRPSKSWKFHWWGQAFASDLGDITDVYTDVGLGSAYASGGVVGTALYFAMTAADAKQIVRGDTMLVVNGVNSADIQVDVLAVNIGSDSTTYVLGALMKADGDSNLASASLTWRLSGHAEEEGSSLPDSTSIDPVEFENCCQIFMQSMEFTGTELAEMERVDPREYQRVKAQSFMRYRNKVERAFIFGVYKVGVGVNGKRKTWTRGLKTAIAENESDRIYNYLTDSDYAGKSWLSGGWDFLKSIMVDTSRYSDTDVKRCYSGDLAWLAINDLVEDMGTYKIEHLTDEFGIHVHRLEGLNTALEIVQHPLFTVDSAYRRSMLITEPALTRYRPMKGRDMKYVKAAQLNQDGYTWVDGKKEGWYGQAGLEYDGLQNMAWVDGLGVTNTAS